MAYKIANLRYQRTPIKMTCHLLSLPVELLDMISCYLDYASTVAARRYLYRAIQESKSIKSGLMGMYKRAYDFFDLLTIERWPCYNSFVAGPENTHKEPSAIRGFSACSIC